MIYFNVDTKEIVEAAEAFEGDELKQNIKEYPDGSEPLLPTNENIEQKWANAERQKVTEEIEELLDTGAPEAQITALRQYRHKLRLHKRNKGKKDKRPVRD